MQLFGFEIDSLALKITAAVDILEFFIIIFVEKIRLDISCESSGLRIRMKYQVLFSLKIMKTIQDYHLLQLCSRWRLKGSQFLKDKCKIIMVLSAAIFLGSLKVKPIHA